MTRLLSIASLGVLVASTLTIANSLPKGDVDYCSVYNRASTPGCQPVPEGFLSSRDDALSTPETDPRVLEDAFSALSVLQNVYFEPVNGTWPTSIHWTGAVVETVIAGMLTTLTQSLDSTERGRNWKEKENLISSIFAQVTHSFFGQNTVAILNQAYDDVLWVVLGWLEAIKFVRLHSSLHYPGSEQTCLNVPGRLSDALGTISFHGYNWYCTFAERARAFWDFATRGWDTSLCDGGMVWNPRLRPYKNAVTNELWISASISMYEYFPNDEFDDAWIASQGFPTNDPLYLAAAIVGYKWLKDVNMTNSQGLYVDGYHVDMSKPNNVECDQRDEMVYTYNQGVILTGQRGLFTVTGSPSYLEDGHTLIQNVIQATGWGLGENAPIDNVNERPRGKLPPWRGIGRGGILEEQCDADGTCSQDSQTFKGIFFHHLTAFCAPISPVDIPGDANANQTEFSKVQSAHDNACRGYLHWVKYNMDAALATRDKAGRFGMWWGASIFDAFDASEQTDGINHTSPNAIDYRNKGTPMDAIWGLNMTWHPGSKTPTGLCQNLLLRPDPKLRIGVSPELSVDPQIVLGRQNSHGDPNDRGRGGAVPAAQHIDLGDSRQHIKCIFDTGSSDIIVPKAGSAVCQLANQQCRKAPIVTGDFEPAESKDVTQVDGSTFNASFTGGDGFDGPYIKTSINIGGAKVDESQVALAVNGSLPGDFPQFPICGVGPVEAEQTDKKYVNLVAKMKENGVIGSNVMGVVLNRNAFENGSVVFGGIDKSKFKGELQEVPIDPGKDGKIFDYVVNMTSIRLQMNDRPPKQSQQGQQGKKGKKGKKGKQGQRGQQVRRSHYGRALPRPSGGSHGHHVLSKREGNNEDNGDNGGRGGKGDRGDRGGNGGKGDRGNGNNRDGQNNKKGNGKNNQNGGNNNNNNSNKNGNQNNSNQNNGNQNNGNQNNGNQNNGNQNNGNQNNGNQNNGNQNNGNQNNGIIDLGLKPSEKFTLIDTGGIGLQLPRDSVEAMAKALGTRFRDGSLDPVDCAVVSDNNKLLFGFNNDKTVVSVPLSHTRISDTVLNAEERASGKCFLGIDAVAPGESLNSMGFPWGSAVYTVFDLDKNRLLFAEAVENSTQPDIQPFP